MLWASKKALSQKGVNDTIVVGSIVINNDTLPHIWLHDAFCNEKGNKAFAKRRREAREQREAYDRLRYNVYKVYPYAVAAGFIMNDIDSAMALMRSKDAKQIYKRRKEDELNKKFKGELVNLTMSQGQVLVKLIARQTGKPCYQHLFALWRKSRKICCFGGHCHATGNLVTCLCCHLCLNGCS